MSYFQTKVSFLRQQDNGTIKKETEQYLVDAMSFTETEARVIREVGESVRDLYFDSIAHSPIQEVVSYGDTDLWFKCKVVYKDVDPDSGKEKKTTLYILVNANDVNEAYDRCKDHLKEMLVPFEIPKVEETSICEIYQYEKPVPAELKPTKDNSAEIWAAFSEEVKQAIIFCINDGHYDTERSSERSVALAIESDGKRRGMDPSAYKRLITYVECVLMNKHGHMDDEDGE